MRAGQVHVEDGHHLAARGGIAQRVEYRSVIRARPQSRNTARPLGSRRTKVWPASICLNSKIVSPIRIAVISVKTALPSS